MLTRYAPGLILCLLASTALAGPLQDYVDKADDSYSWKLRRKGTIGASEYVELTLTSQTWKDVKWRHQLFILKPSTAKADVDHGVLVIEGGSWRDRLAEAPGDRDRLPGEAPAFAAVAEQLAVPVAVLLQVPHQPILGGRYEDDAIAQTFENFMRTGDETWPLLLPMTKSAVRGMDAVQEFSQKQWKLDLQHFTVTGASKRGWTTYLTGAVDPRAKAIAPMVIDMLNMAPQMKHQLDTWGKFSDSIHDYTRRGLQKHLQTDAGETLRQIVDPYSYREQLTQPKLVILGTNDQYWPLDAQNHYWNGLVGEKYMLNIPNNRHGLTDYGRIIGTIGALDAHVNGGPKLPKLDWGFSFKPLRVKGPYTHHTAFLSSDRKPKRVRAWIAHSEDRDFRPDRWTSKDVEADEEGVYRFELPSPDTGYSAMFLEATYEGKALSYYLTTTIRVVKSNAVAEAKADLKPRNKLKSKIRSKF